MLKCTEQDEDNTFVLPPPEAINKFPHRAETLDSGTSGGAVENVINN